MSKTVTDQTLALAGIFRAATEVQRIAHHGRVDSDAFESSLKSIFVTDPENTQAVYDSVASLKEGLEAMVANLGGDVNRRDVEQARYAITLLHLERKLASRRDLLAEIGRGIENARRQAEHFSITHENVVANLADIYSKTVSTLNPRIMVSGEHGHLNQPDNANRVRALLLAGMRSAVLWRQSGGGRFKLLIQRRRYLDEARRLLAGLEG